VNDESVYPPFDRQLAEAAPLLLKQQREVAALSAEEFQALSRAEAARWEPDVAQGGAVDVRELTIPSADGSEDLPVLILAPARRIGPCPVVYYTANGGKMQQGSRVGVTDSEARWVAELGIAFVSVSPRVGPAHPHPAQVEDAYAGLTWMAGHAAELGIDPARIIVMGKSGGGGVAAATALYARDHGGPILAGQMLIGPMLDDRETTVSSRYDVPPWTRSINRIGWSAILGPSAGGPGVSPYAAPARAQDLAGLPAAYLEVGSSEVFRDETLDYATRLAQRGC
jgi:acetyl esterase/lipase